MTPTPVAPKCTPPVTPLAPPLTLADICSAIAAVGWAIYGLRTLGLGFVVALAFAANLRAAVAPRWRGPAFAVQVVSVVAAAVMAFVATFLAEAGRVPSWVPLLRIAVWVFVVLSWGGAVAGWRRWRAA